MKLQLIFKKLSKSLLLLLCLSLVVGGCATATKPSAIPAKSFATGEYQSYDCDRLSEQKRDYQAKYDNAYVMQERRHKWDRGFYTAAIVVGILSFGPGALWGLGVQGDSAITYNAIAESQAEISAINNALRDKNC